MVRNRRMVRWPGIPGLLLSGLLLLGSATPIALTVPDSPFPSVLSAQAVPPKKLAASLQRLFGPDVRTDTLPIETASILRVYRGTVLLGFAQVRQVRGKEQPITCLVALDSTLALRDIDILVYREAYGGEVAYEPWRRQFRGRTARDTLEVGRTVRGISGATISVNAVTLGIRQALADFARWRAAGQL
jgi:hypothetical protein